MASALGAVGKHLAGIVGQSIRTGPAIVDVGGRDDDFFDQRRIGVRADYPESARHPTCQLRASNRWLECDGQVDQEISRYRDTDCDAENSQPEDFVVARSCHKLSLAVQVGCRKYATVSPAAISFSSYATVALVLLYLCSGWNVNA